MSYKEILPEEITSNAFTEIGKNWMLITTGNENDVNTMTASWGQMGIMWNKPVINVYIRPQRFSRKYMAENIRFSVSVFDEGTHRKELGLMGSLSGKDGDKITEAGLSVSRIDKVPVIDNSKMILICKKLYEQDLGGEFFLEKEIDEEQYKAKDYHRMYIAEIEKIFIKE